VYINVPLDQQQTNGLGGISQQVEGATTGIIMMLGLVLIEPISARRHKESAGRSALKPDSSWISGISGRLILGVGGLLRVLKQLLECSYGHWMGNLRIFKGFITLLLHNWGHKT
jgi:hypothetical protein